MPSASPTTELPQDERDLLAALRGGDQRAFQALVEHHYPTMRRVARGYVQTDAVAEEVVQDTWLAVVSGIEGFEGRSSLATWIFSILANKAKSRGVRERRSLPLSCVGGGEEDETAVDADRFQGDDEAWPGHWATPPRPWQKPERRLLSLEARGHLKAALDELPDRQRLVVTLRDVEGLSAGEVCDALGLSPENQRVLLHRGRSRLRASLEDYVEQA
jgi:RNA polymerase sigma-70 factor (ECF subfamily)